MATALGAAVNGFGGLIFGYNTGIIATALDPITAEFGLSTFQQGLLTSSVLLGCIIGTIGGGVIADKIGRKKGLIVIGVLSAAASFSSAFSPNLTVLAILRCLLGLAIGMCTVICPLYVTEVAPAEKRGALGAVFQLSICFGILIAYVVGYFLTDTANGFRYMLGIGSLFCVLHTVVAFFWAAETDVWLLRSRYPASADPTEPLLAQDPLTAPTHGQRASIKDLFAPRYRRALFIALCLATLLQCTGINTVIYYAPKIFALAGFASKMASLRATMILGGWNFLTALIPLFIVERLGRKPLYLFGLGVVSLSIVLLGCVDQFLQGNDAQGYVSVVFLFLYIFGFEAGVGSLFFVIVNELFPDDLRGHAGAIANFVQWSWNLIIALTFPLMIQGIGTAATYWIFGGVGVAGFVVLLAFMPETKGTLPDELFVN